MRFLVGGVFIFSGFVKAIDVWGSIYKFDDYVAILNLSWFASLTHFGGFAVAMFEFVAGVLLFVGCFRRSTPIALSAMMAVMLPLTLYLAITDAVPDCGCFGDAIVISNWATFFKNVFLTAALVYLVRYNKRVVNYYGRAVQWMILVGAMCYSGYIALYGFNVQPMLDFRPFKVGTPLVSETQDDAEFRFIYRKGNVTQEFSIDSIPEDDEWEFVDRIAIGDTISNETLTILDENGDDITANVISNEGEQFLLTFPDIQDVAVSYTYTINELCDFANTHGISLVGLTSGNAEAIDNWKDISMADYDLYTVDDTILKQLVRGNPAIVYLKDGVIVWKRSMRSFNVEPDDDEAFQFDEYIQKSADEGNKNLRKVSITFVAFLIGLLILNRSHLLLNVKKYFKRKKITDKSK